jgi:pimeloyl-ACP methyl ester carboxylesterase
VGGGLHRVVAGRRVVPPGREDLELLATAAHLLGRVEDCLRALRHHAAGPLGGVWALWYALARPDRVKRLVLLGVPALPRTRCPLPIRLVGTPGLGRLLSRLAPPGPGSVLRLASAVGEKATLARRPDLVDLLVAAGRDPITDRAAKAELSALISPFALLTPSGFRRRARVRPDQLRQLALPTLVLWGERDPVGSIAVARAVAELVPDGRLEVLPAGHGPWLGLPTRTAATVTDFAR